MCGWERRDFKKYIIQKQSLKKPTNVNIFDTTELKVKVLIFKKAKLFGEKQLTLKIHLRFVIVIYHQGVYSQRME
jgi:hypothetical protein